MVIFLVIKLGLQRAKAQVYYPGLENHMNLTVGSKKDEAPRRLLHDVTNT